MWTQPQSVPVTDASSKWLVYTAIGLDMQRNDIKDFVVVTEIWEAPATGGDERAPSQREDRTEGIMALGQRGEETYPIFMRVERDRKGRFSKIIRRHDMDSSHIEMMGPMATMLTCKPPRDPAMAEAMARLAEESRIVLKDRHRVH